MDSRLLTILLVLAACAVCSAQEERHFRCYECNRWEVGIFNGGDDEDECEYPGRDTPVSEEHCKFCLMDTRWKVFDWVERKCVKDDDACVNGTVVKSFVDLDLLDLSDATEYDVERECCEGDLCNSRSFDTDAAPPSMRASHFLLTGAAAAGLLYFLL